MMQQLQSTPFYHFIRNIYVKWDQRKEFNAWKKKGKGGSSPHILKQKIIREFSNNNNLKTLVETGTYRGDMVEAMKKYFNKIYSIELDKELYRKAKNRFNNQKKISIKQGDSSNVLKNIIPLLSEPAIFWLDGHYSAGVTAKGEKETPILEELNVILNESRLSHILLIDDARLFGVDRNYPSIKKLSQFIKEQRAEAIISVKDDIIRVVLN
jgi:hypothetical protein